jgi:flagellar L-ring protein precursor FlgH
MLKPMIKYLAILGLSVGLIGCNTVDRLQQVGKAPEFTKIEDPRTQPDYQKVSLPMPAKHTAKRLENSLWAADRKSFFKDQRASNIGDILTVMVNIEDSAELENRTERTRESAENFGLNGLLGLENRLTDVLDEGTTGPGLVDFGGDSETTGEGLIERDETIELKVAAMITEVLPNGNFVVHGRQEVRVNYEVRELQIMGVIRPEDIRTDNTISYEKIAEARIAYGGRGQISDLQQPRYGNQVFDILFPF